MSSNASITTTTDVLLTGLSLTPGAGDYMVFASVTIDRNASEGSEFAVISIYLNGSQVAHTERLVLLPRLTSNSGATHAFVTGVGATDTIEVRWRTTNERFLTAKGRSLTVIEVN